jgi:hypothetical protein
VWRGAGVWCWDGVVIFTNRAPVAQLDQSVWLRTRRPGVRISPGAPFRFTSEFNNHITSIYARTRCGAQIPASNTPTNAAHDIKELWLVAESVEERLGVELDQIGACLVVSVFQPLEGSLSLAAGCMNSC